MKVLPFKTEDHYQVVKSWWDQYEGWDAIHPDILSDTGFIVFEDDEPLVAGWMYLTNSKVAWLEWVVSNPECDRIQRATAIHLLIGHITHMTDSLGLKMLMSAVVNPGFIEKLKEHSFQEADKTRIMIRARR